MLCCCDARGCGISHMSAAALQASRLPAQWHFNRRLLSRLPFREKRKQYAEQAAAMCCLLTHGIDDGRVKEPSDQTPELRQKWQQLAKVENHTTNCAAEVGQHVITARGGDALGSSSKVYSASSPGPTGDRSGELGCKSGTVLSEASSNHS